jgi:hypothetical protein
MPLHQSKTAITNNSSNFFDELLYLKSIIDSANHQLKIISTPDEKLGSLIDNIVVLNTDNLREIYQELTKINTRNRELDNVVTIFNQHIDAFKNVLYLEIVIVKSYGKVINYQQINFSLRKKLQTQLNNILYACLEVKLLRFNPNKIPHKNLGLLF